jgi:hypothetical protein
MQSVYLFPNNSIDLQKYTKALRCDANKIKLDRSQINDNFCDCKDGFDEPGMSE